MKTLPPPQPKLAEHARFIPRLTRRDLSLLIRLWRFGVLLRDQIHVMAFDECALRRCNRRLKILADAGLIVPFTLPLGIAPGCGLEGLTNSPGQRAYRLGLAAVSLVAREVGADLDSIERRIRQGSPTYVAHALAVAQVAVAFTVGLRDMRYLISGGLQGEAESRHAYQYRRTGGEWETAVIKPDAVVKLHFRVQTLTLFLEVDLGHMSPSSWREKTSQYLLYEQSGALRSRYGQDACYSVLTMTTTSERMKRLMSQAREVGAAHLFRYGATLPELFTADASMPVWYSPESGEKATFAGIVRASLDPEKEDL